MIKMKTPISEEDVRKLKIGDQVELSGLIVTARDMAHKYMVEKKPDFVRDYLKDGVIYHCGPIVAPSGDDGKDYKFVSAGPTTSAREEPYQSKVIDEYSVRGVIGKGGMGPNTLDGLNKTGAVYLHAVGGAGTLTGNLVEKVHTVFMLEEFGVPEAFWVIEVKAFPLVVSMDSHNGSLHKSIKDHSTNIAYRLIQEI